MGFPAYVDQMLEHLNGEDPIDDRLKKASEFFFSTSKIIPQYKEELVLKWIIKLLTKKKIKSHDEILWATLRDFIESKHLEKLIKENKSEFTIPKTFSVTLVRAVNKKENPTLDEVLRICKRLDDLPCLTRQFCQEDFCFGLCVAMLKRMSMKELNPFIYSCLLDNVRMIKLFLLKTNTEIDDSLIYSHLLLPCFEVVFYFKNSTGNEIIEEILENVEAILEIAFKKLNKVNFNDLDLYLNKTDTMGSEFSHMWTDLLNFISSCINLNDEDVTAYIFEEVCIRVFGICKKVDCYYQEKNIYLNFLIVLLYLVGFQVGSYKVKKKNYLPKSLVLYDITQSKREKLIFVACEVTANCLPEKYTHTQEQWVSDFACHFFSQREASVDILRSLIILFRRFPMAVKEMPSLISSVLKFRNRIFESNFEISNYANLWLFEFDELLCEVVKFNNISLLHENFDFIFGNILEVKESEFFISEVPEMHLISFFNCTRNQHFGPKMQSTLRSAVREMNFDNVVTLWKNILKFLSKSCLKAFKEGMDCSVSLCVGISTRCLADGGSRFKETLASSPVASTNLQLVAELMNNLAESVLVPFLVEFRSLSKETSELRISVLNLLQLWIEMQSSFLSTFLDYEKHTKFVAPTVEAMKKSPSATNLSALVPFLETTDWDSVVSSLSKSLQVDRTKAAFISLVLLKVEALHKLIMKHKNDKELRFYKRECLDFVLSGDGVDEQKYPLCNHLIVTRVASYFPLMVETHIDAFARMFLSGILKKSSLWYKFSESHIFQDNALLQNAVLRALWLRLTSMSISQSTKKRKHEQIEDLQNQTPKDFPQLVTLLKATFMMSININSSQFWTFLTNSLSIIQFNGNSVSIDEEEREMWLKVVELLPVSHMSDILLLKTLVVLMASWGCSLNDQLKKHPWKQLMRLLMVDNTTRFLDFVMARPLFNWLLEYASKEDINITETHLEAAFTDSPLIKCDDSTCVIVIMEILIKSLFSNVYSKEKNVVRNESIKQFADNLIAKNWYKDDVHSVAVMIFAREAIKIQNAYLKTDTKKTISEETMSALKAFCITYAHFGIKIISKDNTVKIEEKTAPLHNILQTFENSIPLETRNAFSTKYCIITRKKKYFYYIFTKPEETNCSNIVEKLTNKTYENDLAWNRMLCMTSDNLQKAISHIFRQMTTDQWLKEATTVVAAMKVLQVACQNKEVSSQSKILCLNSICEVPRFSGCNTKDFVKICFACCNVLKAMALLLNNSTPLLMSTTVQVVTALMDVAKRHVQNEGGSQVAEFVHCFSELNRIFKSLKSQDRLASAPTPVAIGNIVAKMEEHDFAPPLKYSLELLIESLLSSQGVDQLLVMLPDESKALLIDIKKKFNFKCKLSRNLSAKSV